MDSSNGATHRQTLVHTSHILPSWVRSRRSISLEKIASISLRSEGPVAFSRCLSHSRYILRHSFLVNNVDITPRGVGHLWDFQRINGVSTLWVSPRNYSGSPSPPSGTSGSGSGSGSGAGVGSIGNGGSGTNWSESINAVIAGQNIIISLSFAPSSTYSSLNFH